MRMLSIWAIAVILFHQKIGKIFIIYKYYLVEPNIQQIGLNEYGSKSDTVY